MANDFVKVLDSAAVTSSGKASAIAPHVSEVKAALATAALDNPASNMDRQRARELAREVSESVEETRLLIKAVKDGKADASLIYRAEMEGYILRNPESPIARAEAIRARIREARAEARKARK